MHINNHGEYVITDADIVDLNAIKTVTDKDTATTQQMEQTIEISAEVTQVVNMEVEPHNPFERTEFPWEIFPPELTESLNQLARSCATSSLSLPGNAFCVIASSLGGKLGFSPKENWIEPAIIWHSDIRTSGLGKSPAAGFLLSPLYNYSEEKMETDRLLYELSNRTIDNPAEADPEAIENFIVSDFSIEGLRSILKDHSTGGLLCDCSELSSFITGQRHANDRENWLKLWDGTTVVKVRAHERSIIENAAVSLCGGIQPEVFRCVFGQKNKLFLNDGTIFRFLIVHEEKAYYELTDESWSEDNSSLWCRIIYEVIEWSRKQEETKIITFTKEARRRFIAWRNFLYEQSKELPDAVKGFIPKAVSYAVRLAGILHCIEQFRYRCSPGNKLEITDITRGIKAAEFYLGQSVVAIKDLILKRSRYGFVNSERHRVFAKTLQHLKGRLENGMLTIGEIHDEFNKHAQQGYKFWSPKAIGLFIREIPLTVSDVKHRVNGRQGRCLVWDIKTVNYLKSGDERDKQL